VWERRKLNFLGNASDGSNLFFQSCSQYDMDDPIIWVGWLDDPIIGVGWLDDPIIGLGWLDDPIIGVGWLDDPIIGVGCRRSVWSSTSTIYVGQLVGNCFNRSDDRSTSSNLKFKFFNRVPVQVDTSDFPFTISGVSATT
jgi:hypothetical protein